MNVYTIEENISAPKKQKRTPQQTAALKAKRKERRKKAFFIFKKIALSLGRGAFLTLVVLNLGGLATKMKKLMDVGKFDSTRKTWQKLGGSIKKLEKVILKGAKKKPFFLSKAQRNKFNKKLQNISIAPAVIAAIGAAAPVLVSILGAMAKEFKKTGDKKTAAAIEQEQSQALETTKEIIKADQEETAKEKPQADEEAEALEQYLSESIDEEYLQEIGAINPEQTGQLVEAGGKILGAAFKAIGNAFRRKKKNKAGATFEKIGQQTPEQIENYFTGAYLRKAGALDEAKKYQKEFGSTGGKILPFAIGGAALAAVYMLAKNK